MDQKPLTQLASGRESDPDRSMGCDRCGETGLPTAYRTPTGKRGLRVVVCPQCGLVQSLPRVDRGRQHVASVTSDAGWGNIRYGKALRTPSALTYLEQALRLENVTTCLDLGASRGDFIKALKARAPSAEVLAVEPDTGILKPYQDFSGVTVALQRIEDICLLPGRFDLIYCSHTLEHLISPSRQLKLMAKALSPTGRMFIEVPNLDFITTGDIIEEWFIDKHLYHFSLEALTGMVREAGLEIDDGQLHTDPTYITLIAKAETDVPAPMNGYANAGADVAADARQKIADYSNRLRTNIQRLAGVAGAIDHIVRSGQRLVVWGGGRILDSLVRHGGLDPISLTAIVDTFLVDIVQEVHGCRISRPEDLGKIKPDVVVVASREYFDEIADHARHLCPTSRIIGYHQLFEQEPALEA